MTNYLTGTYHESFFRIKRWHVCVCYHLMKQIKSFIKKSQCHSRSPLLPDVKQTYEKMRELSVQLY